MHRQPSHLMFWNRHGHAATGDDAVAFVHVQHVSRLRWTWSLRQAHTLQSPIGRRFPLSTVPVIGSYIAGGKALTKGAAIDRARVNLNTYLHNKENP